MSCFPRFGSIWLAVAIVSPPCADAQTRHWTPAGYGGSGLFPVVAVDPTPETDVVYLGSDVAGVYKSTDGGDTWRAGNSGLVSLQIASLEIDPSDPRRLWVGTPLGLHLSEDGGQSWTLVDGSINSFKHVDNRGIAISPDGKTLLVTHHDLDGEPEDGVYSGTLHRSTDAGVTWQAVLSFSDVAISAVVIDRHQPTNAYIVVADRGVQRSTDGGATWHDFSNGLPGGRTWKQLDVGQNVLYVTAEPLPGSTGVGVFKSAKSNASWSSALNGLDTGEEAGGEPLGDPIRISPGDDQTVYLGQDAWPFNFYRTTDGGTTWVGTPLDTNYVFDPVNNPQQTWVDRYLAAFDIAIDPNRPNRIFYTTWGGILRSDDGGATFTEKIVGAQNVCSTDIMAINGAMLETNMDGGHTFARSFPAAPNLGEDELEYVEAIAVNPADPNDISVSTARRYPVWYNRGSVWRTTDGAATWSEITGDLPILRVRNVTYDDDGALWISTWCGGTYSTDLATTCTQPSIDQHPQGSTVAAGGTATLSVSATGTAPLNHQWYRGDSGDTVDPISGATEASYTTDPLTETTSFWVRVGNDCGSVDSATATITVGSTAPRPRLPSGRAVPNRP